MGKKVVVRRVDPQGRVTVPVDWRSEPIDPTSLFDSILVSDDADFSDPHSLRRALLFLRKEEH